jgi:hypothetical protein
MTLRGSIAGVLCAVSTLLAATAGAQADEREQPDPTRLDVERLPPEALELTRDMFHHGLYLSGHLGGRGFLRGVGRLLEPGVSASMRLGYELLPWLMLATGLELSLHETSAPPPPSPTTVEMIDVLLEARLQLPLSVRAALWVSGEGGINWAGGTYLPAYGVEGAGDPDFMFGGSVGFDWHLLSRHHSLGLTAGARRYRNLTAVGGERSIGLQSSAYLKYVF